MDSPSSLRSPLPRPDPHAVREVLYRIGMIFSHCQYAVCGTAAMTAYGFTARRPAHVSIVCPAYTREVVMSWAAAAGLQTYPEDPDAFGVATAAGDTYKVRVKYLATDDNHRFDRLETMCMRVGEDDTLTQVLTLPALVNQIAMAYVDERWGADRDVLAGDVAWLLRRICEDGTGLQRLEGARIPGVREPAFWLGFSTAHPVTAGLFYDAGFRPCLESCPPCELDVDMIRESREPQTQVETSASRHVHFKQQQDPEDVSAPRPARRRGRDSVSWLGGWSLHEPPLTRAERRAVASGKARLTDLRVKKDRRELSLTDALDKLFLGFQR
ncbi:hypothetical protein CMUS01_14604 [Colletotrichum musicola]|uniref:Uncharacterized protein n=1 Tax=Colletotrichum musicola TaxID=2175873 RepID=A0A8H6J2X8_9PEZI|nr:hypothetical protein CMUS01_14604 [Colletotrichum musicola]